MIRGALLLTLATLLWSGNYIAGRMLAPAMPAFLLNGVRWTVSAALLLLLMSASGKRVPYRARWRELLLLGFIGMFVFSTLTYLGLHTVPAAQAGMISGAIPAGILLLSVLLLHERPSPLAWSGMALSILGVAVLVGAGHTGHFAFSIGDVELIAAALPAPPPEAAGAVKLAELPFDFGRRRLSVLVGRPGEPPLLVTKGAPEVLVPRAGAIRLPDGSTVPLDPAGARQITALAEAAAARGRRSIAVGSRELPAGTAALDLEAESGLVFEGLLVFSDPPRPGVAEVLAELRSRGVELKVITGDHELVARDVARKVGLPVAGVLTGEQMRGLAHEAFVARAERTTIFARVDPDQKLRVVRALRGRGAIVGYLGDGINDAPPLHVADVGISVDNATDVAREAADIILLEPDLEDVNRGVIEGRRTFANTLKYIRMGTSSNFGNMLSMAAASLFLPFLPMLPGQILLNNLVYDASQTAIPSDDIDPEAADEPVHWNLPTIERFMITFGPISSVFDFLTFGLLLLVLRADEAAFHTGWFTESLATQVLVVLAIRTSRVPFWRSRPSPLLLAAVLAAVAAAILIPLSPIGPVIGFVVLPPLYWLLLAATVATYLVLVEIVKSRLLGRAGRS